jgi:hypothetical protein
LVSELIVSFFFSIALLILYLVLFFATLSDLARRCSDTKEKYAQSQVDLSQTSAFLDSTRALKSSLKA